jgi:hypothetical protein
MIVKVTCNWSSNDEIKKRLVNQFGNKESLDGINIITDGDNYDLLVAFGYVTEQPVNNKPIFVFPQEPTWSGNHQKQFNNLDNIKIFGFDKNYYTPINSVVETVAHMFYPSYR